jgi:hypothetical protein
VGRGEREGDFEQTLDLRLSWGCVWPCLLQWLASFVYSDSHDPFHDRIFIS